MYSVELKIKRVTLADEARTIRREKNVAKAEGNRSRVTSLHEHRVNIVRPAARAAELAHAYLRGKPYVLLERTRRTDPSVDEIRKLVSKFGNVTLEPKEVHKLIVNWIEGVGLEPVENSKSPSAGSIPASPS